MIIIYGIDQHLDSIKSRLSNVIHDCMQTALGLPEGKRAHRFISMDAADGYYPGGRSPTYTVIEIDMMQGRALQTHRLPVKTLFARIESILGIVPADVEITIREQPAHCRGFRDMTGDEARDLDYSVNV